MSSPNTSWGRVADWYSESVSRADSYQQELIYPNLLRMSLPLKKERVLDVACGDGSFALKLTSIGCDVFGVDISPALISKAKEKVPSGQFIISKAEDLTSIKEKDFDKAFIILALQNMEDVGKTISETARLLRKEGKLYVVLNHPCFRIPGFSEWGWDDKAQYRKVSRYLSESVNRILMHPGSDPSVTTASFHRPLQFFFKAFYKAGFAVTRLEEWNSSKTSQPGPRAQMENRARKEIPLFMALECVKLGL